jgi:hypothetical protein
MSLSSNPIQETGPPNTEVSSNVFSEQGPPNTELSSAVSVGIVSRLEQLDQSPELPPLPLNNTTVHFRAPEILLETTSAAVSSTSSTQVSSLDLDQYVRPDRDHQPPTGEASNPQNKFGSGSSATKGKEKKKKIDPDLIGPNEPTEQWVQDRMKGGGDPDTPLEDLEEADDLSEGEGMLELRCPPRNRPAPQPQPWLEPSVTPVPAEEVGESSAAAARRAEMGRGG